MDTCCIDKSSSAELSEAINSMFRWYQNAQICYVWLRDVQHRSLDDIGPMTFRGSAWFTRGWTLQELLAPRLLVFYDRSWIEVGTRSSLEETIASVTGITLPLDGWRSASVAQKMSWASKRKTSRVEDIAYCLLGLFGVSMAPLYGEGVNAFLRLQLEIIGKTDDQSIFAWTAPSHVPASALSVECGLLTHFPAAFENSRDIQQKVLPGKTPSYSVTNRGLRLEQQTLLPIEQLGPTPENEHSGLHLAVLNCSRTSSDEHLGVYLRRHLGLDDFGRVKIGELASFPGHLLEQSWDKIPAPVMYVRQLIANPEEDSHREAFRIDLTSARDEGYFPPTFEASEPYKRSSPTESPWDQLLVFDRPFADPMWAIVTFHRPGEACHDFEILLARDEFGINTYFALPPRKLVRPAKRLRGPIGKTWGWSGHPYWEFPKGPCRLPSGKWVSSLMRNAEIDNPHAHAVIVSFRSSVLRYTLDVSNSEQRTPGRAEELAEGRVLFDFHPYDDSP